MGHGTYRHCCILLFLSAPCPGVVVPAAVLPSPSPPPPPLLFMIFKVFPFPSNVRGVCCGWAPRSVRGSVGTRRGRACFVLCVGHCLPGCSSLPGSGQAREGGDVAARYQAREQPMYAAHAVPCDTRSRYLAPHQSPPTQSSAYSLINLCHCGSGCDWLLT